MPNCTKTGLPMSLCAHCRPSLPQSPKYSLQFDTYKGNDVVEILKDGGPIHANDKEWRFGRNKAKLILAAVEILEEFVTKSNEGIQILPRSIRDDTFGISLDVHIEEVSGFVRSTGQFIDRYWLKLIAVPGPDPHIGVGFEKAKAVLALKDDIKDWVLGGKPKGVKSPLTDSAGRNVRIAPRKA
jgi:hypothetical protein